MSKQRMFLCIYFFLVEKFNEVRYLVEHKYYDNPCLFCELDEIAKMLLDIGHRLDLYEED